MARNIVRWAGRFVTGLAIIATLFAWAPDSQHLVAAKLDQTDASQTPTATLEVVDRKGGRTKIPLQASVRQVLGVSPDGRVAYVTQLL